MPGSLAQFWFLAPQSQLELLEAMGAVLIRSLSPANQGNVLTVHSECKKINSPAFLSALVRTGKTSF